MDEDASFYRTSPFCAITDQTGVCYNISEGLAFLFNMVGINAGSVGSYEGTGAHEWVIAQLDGRYYYFDATWEAGNSECDSLTYFAITEEDRAGWAGWYPPESVVFAAILPVAGEYDLSDTRFEPIHGDATASGRQMPTGRLAVPEKPFGLAPFLRFFNRCGMLASLNPPQAAVGPHSQRAPYCGRRIH